MAIIKKKKKQLCFPNSSISILYPSLISFFFFFFFKLKVCEVGIVFTAYAIKVMEGLVVTNEQSNKH